MGDDLKLDKILFGLRNRRIQLEMSQEKLAQKVEVSRETIRSIESGKHSPSLWLFLKICDALKFDVTLQGRLF